MDQELKQRLIGAAVIIALAIIFVPMMFDNEGSHPQQEKVSISIPEENSNNLEVKTFNLDQPVNDAGNPSVSALPPAEVELAVVEQQPELIEISPPDDRSETSSRDFTHGDPPAVAQTEPTASTKPEPVQPEPTVVPENKPQTQPQLDQPATPKVSETTTQKPPPAQKPTVSVNQAYRVKLGSFSQQANAERVKNQLLQKNIQAVVEYNAGLKLYRVWSQQLYQNESSANQYLNQVNAQKLNIGTPKVIALDAAEVTQMAAQGQMGWVVQLGSFSSKENALTLRNKVKAAGFVGFVDEIQNNQGVQIYRMRVGPLMEKQDAEQIKTEILNRLKLPGLIKPHELSRMVQ